MRVQRPRRIPLALLALAVAAAGCSGRSPKPTASPTSAVPTTPAASSTAATPVPFPSAAPVGDFTADDVRAALVTVRDLAGASYKNVSVLRGETLDPLPNLWTAAQHRRYQQLETQWRQVRESKFLVLVSTFDTSREVPVEPYFKVKREDFHAPTPDRSDDGTPGLAVRWTSEITYYLTVGGTRTERTVRRQMTYLLVRSGVPATPWLVAGYSGTID